jgi:NADPH:quinone reductase-like Zn-dependent oxidoreductase
MKTTEAWVLRTSAVDPHTPAKLVREEIALPEPGPSDVLVEPIYGCWEANMSHALMRSPVDVCKQRGEDKVVVGNAGVVRVVAVGDEVTLASKGDLCFVFAGEPAWNEHGFMKRALAYDLAGSVGLLARQTVLHERQVIPIAKTSRFNLAQWAAFSLRYVTAWASWKLALGTWRLLVERHDLAPHVWSWGGGVGLAQLELARLEEYPCAMVASSDERLEQLARRGITAIDRRTFSGLAFDEARYRSDSAYRSAYQRAEATFLAAVHDHT